MDVYIVNDRVCWGQMKHSYAALPLVRGLRLVFYQLNRVEVTSSLRR